MGALFYYNGRIMRREEAYLPISDRSIFFADAVYDVILGHRNAGLYQLKEHFERLTRSAGRIGLTLPEEALSEIIKMSEMSEDEIYYLYVQVSRTAKVRRHAPEDCEAPSLLMMLDKAEIPPENRQYTAITAEDIRYGMCDVKTTNLLPAVLASMEAAKADCDEAIFVRHGIVTEGAKSNVFMLKGNTLLTHPLSCRILPGIMRENVIRAAGRVGLKIAEVEFGRDDMLRSDGVILTSTTKFALPLSKIDGVHIRTLESGAVLRLISVLKEDFYLHFAHNI